MQPGEEGSRTVYAAERTLNSASAPRRSGSLYTVLIKSRQIHPEMPSISQLKKLDGRKM
jgi:hypothetical protein